MREVYAKFLFRRLGESTEMGPWQVAPILPFSSVCEDHDQTVAGWNKKDKGKTAWRWVEVLPGDYDHPDTPATTVRIDDWLRGFVRERREQFTVIQLEK